MYRVLSCSLDPASRSRILAVRAKLRFDAHKTNAELIDLRDHPLPFCDGNEAFSDPDVAALTERIRSSAGILLATPIYNFDANAVLKNLIELTGRTAWQDQVVGFLCAAGGKSSYMSIMSLANSLMLDFRTFIIPRFVYADGSSFDEDQLDDAVIEERLDELVETLIRVSTAIKQSEER